MDAREPRGRREVTLLGRLRRPRDVSPVTVRGEETPVPAAPRGPAPLDSERLERLVLVTHTFGRTRAAALLDGLRACEGLEARALLQRLSRYSSADRQARVAQPFGLVPEAAERLRSLMAEASAPLQAEILRRLPPYHRSLFPPAALSRDEAGSPAMGVLAERLIREATR
jgi:hypothetical protein